MSFYLILLLNTSGEINFNILSSQMFLFHFPSPCYYCIKKGGDTLQPLLRSHPPLNAQRETLFHAISPFHSPLIS